MAYGSSRSQGIEPYRFQHIIHESASSSLYLALHPAISKPLAVKVIHANPRFSGSSLERLLQESRLVSMAHHPNLAKIYGQGLSQNLSRNGPYLAMEFIQGISLKQFIQPQKLSLPKAIDILRQTGYALCHLHAHGILHRDIRSEHILLTEKGRVKVIDFGLANVPATYASDLSGFVRLALELLPETSRLRALLAPWLQEKPEHRSGEIVRLIACLSSFAELG